MTKLHLFCWIIITQLNKSHQSWWHWWEHQNITLKFPFYQFHQIISSDISLSCLQNSTLVLLNITLQTHSLPLAVWLSQQAWLVQKSSDPGLSVGCASTVPTQPRWQPCPCALAWHGAAFSWGAEFSSSSWHGLCFGYEAVLIIQGCFPYCWAALNRAKAFFCSSPTGAEAGIAQGVGRGQGQDSWPRLT